MCRSSRWEDSRRYSHPCSTGSPCHLQASPMQVALAWLLQRSPNILLIPGTSSIKHLRENLGAAELELSSDAITDLNGIAKNVAVARQSTHGSQIHNSMTRSDL